MKKGFAPIIIISAAALLLVGIAVLVFQAEFFSKGKTPSSTPIAQSTTYPNLSPSPSPAEQRGAQISDETANWKTYTSKKYGYSVKYPGGDFKLDNEWDSRYAVIYKGEKLDLPSYSIIDPFSKAEASISFVQGYALTPQEEPLGTEMSLAGNKAIKSVSDRGSAGDLITITIYSPKGNVIKATYSEGHYVSVYNQILSTFKFLD